MFTSQLLKSKPILTRYTLSKTFASKSKSFEQTKTWAQMSRAQRINCALAECDLQSGEMAYYQGLGYKVLGQAFYSDAVYSFKKAAELDNSLSHRCNREMASIYENIGEDKSAILCMKLAYEQLLNVPAKAERRWKAKLKY